MLPQSSGWAYDPASFRDPTGRVIVYDGHVLRSVTGARAAAVERLLASSFYRLRAGRDIVATIPASLPMGEDTLVGDGELMLEHERIDPITYPYEWPFSLLKRAAEFHLDTHLTALESGFDLSDSSAYNIQFVGCRPVFIDLLSFVDYSPGRYWYGYKQFCEQFLCPLLVTAKTGTPYNDWYRGTLNGLDIRHCARMMPALARLSPSVYIHLMLHARMIDRVQSHGARNGLDRTAKGLTPAGLNGLLRGMRRLIRSLKPKGLQRTYWKDYEFHNSYSMSDTEQKRRIVQEFISRARPRTILDIGCNSGEFSEICLGAGAERAVCVDSDLGALEAAVSRAEEKQLNLLPLYLDLANPSPSHGWAGIERPSFADRVKPDALIALALLHHLVIGKNIRMPDAVGWIVDRAPVGLLEFVPRSDPMVQGMLLHRADMFGDYTLEAFRSILSSKAKILSEQPSSTSGRRIFAYER